METFHQPPLLLPVLLATGSVRTEVGRRVHAAVLENLNELASKRGDVLLDLVHVVFGDSFRLGAPLLDRHVAPHEVPHDALIAKVSLARLLNLLHIEESHLIFRKWKVRALINISLYPNCLHVLLLYGL